MSKERLEEFREFVDFMYESIDIEDHQRFIAISDSMLNDGWFKWIYRLAKEQAERVQELEGIKNDAIEQIDVTQERNKRLENRVQELENTLRIWMDRSDHLSGEYLKYKEQNKCYREALEFIGNHANESEMMDDVMYTELVREVIEKALEE